MTSDIDTLGRLVQESIASDDHKAGMFSVQLDTTQDITGHDQCSVILHERLFALVWHFTTSAMHPLGKTLWTCSQESGSV